MPSSVRSALAAVGRVFDRVVVRRLADRTWLSSAGVVLCGVGVALFMVRVLGAAWPGRYRIFFPDSFSFINAAKLTPFSPAFYAAERPIAFPTLLFLLGRSTVVTVVVQTFLYATAYVFAARIVCRLLHHDEVKVLASFMVVMIGLEPRFALWNTHILSESLGMTLALVSVISWWRFSADSSVVRLRWAALTTIGWLVARDSNVPPWLAVGVPALLIASVFWKSADPSLRRALRRWGIITLVVCVAVAMTQAANGRNRFATMNNVGLRVLPDRDLTEYFVDRGMPVNDALLERTGFSSFDNDWKMLNSADLADFRAWAESSGQREMLLSYVRFLPHWLTLLRHDLPVLLKSDQSAYDAFEVSKRLPEPLGGHIGGPQTGRGVLAWTFLSCSGLLLAARRRRVQSVVLGLILASSFVDLYMAYVGDSVEVQRHMVGPLARMTIVMVLCIALGMDSLVEMWRQRSPHHAGSAEAVDAVDARAHDVELVSA